MISYLLRLVVNLLMKIGMELFLFHLKKSITGLMEAALAPISNQRACQKTNFLLVLKKFFFIYEFIQFFSGIGFKVFSNNALILANQTSIFQYLFKNARNTQFLVETFNCINCFSYNIYSLLSSNMILVRYSKDVC